VDHLLSVGIKFIHCPGTHLATAQTRATGDLVQTLIFRLVAFALGTITGTIVLVIARTPRRGIASHILGVLLGACLLKLPVPTYENSGGTPSAPLFSV
jgi:hypothetical protein